METKPEVRPPYPRIATRREMDRAFLAHKAAYPEDPLTPILQQAMEELSELSAAISRVLRGRKDLDHGLILEEFADVKICMGLIEQLADMDVTLPVERWKPRTFHYEDVIQMKAARAADRLEEIVRGQRKRPTYGHT